MQLDSNKKGSSKALIFVHTFKCKIAADIQHRICTKKSTKILSPSCLGSCQFICPLPFPSVHYLVVPVKSEKQWEEVLAVSWRRRSLCASRGKHLPPSLPQGSLQEGEPMLSVSRAWLSVLSVLTFVFVVQLESDLHAGLWGFCKLGLYRALPQAGGEASVACARLRHALFALFFFFFP